MIRLMAFDLDGTLLGPEALLEPVVREAISDARVAGITVTLATGRMYCSARQFAAELGLGSVPLIVFNGALIQDNINERVYRHHVIDHATACLVGRYLADAGVHVNIYRGDALYVNEYDPITEQYERRIGVTATVSPGVLADLPWAPTKLLAVAAPAEVKRLAAGIRALVADRVAIASSHPTFLEITGRSVNKGAALAEVATMLGIDRAEVLAAGDGLNDLEMIRYAGIGVAAHGSYPEVLAEADCHAGPGPAGIAAVIRQATAGRLMP
ncbi:MAG: Cof-type HAD-IIB family hydrolase [Chloroflexota bacterium]